MTRVLVVDDEPGVRAALVQLLEYEGVETRAVGSGAEALSSYEEWRPAVTFLDVKMAGMDGLETLKRLRKLDAVAVVVMISGHATIRDAIEATQSGAYDILEKPLDTDRILVTLRNALGTQVLRAENARLREHVESKYEIVGASYAIRNLIAQIETVAPTTARVLISGENGTGKELVARALHARSPRVARPFIEVNCAAIPSELIESELFGHVRGSFTGAVADRAGKFEQADDGTLFLDEVGDMSLAAQAKVLRVLQDGEVTRIGGRQAHQGGRARALGDEQAPRGRDPRRAISRGPLLPPERRSDDRAAAPRAPRRHPAPRDTFPRPAVAARRCLLPRAIEADALERLRQFEWPGNVRELRNTIERLLILSAGPKITRADIDRLVGVRPAEAGGLGDLIEFHTFEDFKVAAERAFLLAKLRQHDWNVAETARIIDMPRSNLYKKIERYRLMREPGGGGGG